MVDRAVRVVSGRLVPALASVLLATVACSAPEPVAPPPAAPIRLANSSWSGTCSGAAIGTYTFDFGPGDSNGGTVSVAEPGAPQKPRQARYRLTPAGAGTAAFTIDLTPPWQGTLQRDRRNLVLSFSIGASPGHQCNLLSTD